MYLLRVIMYLVGGHYVLGGVIMYLLGGHYVLVGGHYVLVGRGVIMWCSSPPITSHQFMAAIRNLRI